MAKRVQEFLSKNGKVPPMAYIVTERKGEQNKRDMYAIDIKPFLDSQEGKGRLIYFLKEMVKLTPQIATVGVVVEAWFYTVNKKNLPKRFEELNENIVRPSEHPDRRECVMITVNHVDHKNELFMVSFERDHEGKIVKTYLDESMSKEMENVQSIFSKIFG